MSGRGQQDWVASGFEVFEQGLNGERESTVHGIRRQAFTRFQEIGFPTPKEEDWKYTNVIPRLREPFAVSQLAETVKPDVKQLSACLPDIEGGRLVFVNGVFSEELSAVPRDVPGVALASMAQVLSSHDHPHCKAVEEHFSRHASTEQSFAALNTAFALDGALIVLERNAVVEQPLQVFFLSSDAAKDMICHPRLLLLAAEGSKAHLIEGYQGLAENRYCTSAVSEFRLGEGAQVDHYRLQREGENACHISNVSAHLEGLTTFRTFTLALSGALIRNNIGVTIDGEGSHADLLGLSILNSDQHVDNHTVLDHAKAHCTSNEVYKGIYFDHSTGVFDGTIIVREGAQKTNAVQSNKSLLLSENATINAKPQLKIWADDVKCTHGATVGKLDQDQLFYLQTRGIGQEEARRMLVQAFAGEVAAQLPKEALREFVGELVAEKLRQAMRAL